MKAFIYAGFTAVFLNAGPAHAVVPTVTFLGLTPYHSFADSPFNGVGLNSFQLETFENGPYSNGVPKTLGVTSTTPGTVLDPSSLTDSVDGDDGVIDGSGQNGHSLHSVGSGGAFTTFAFDFDAQALGGHLPTHVGFVWTDVGNATIQGQGAVRFSVYDSAHNLIDFFDSGLLGDGNANGATDEDRFFGAIFNPGIGRIEIAMATSVDWEIDHLQYGVAPVPLPATVWGMGAGLLALVRRRSVANRTNNLVA